MKQAFYPYNDINVYTKDDGLKKLDLDSIHCDPMSYVMVWTFGEPWLHISMSALLERKTNVCQNILMREYLSSRLMLCGCPPTGNFNPIYTNIIMRKRFVFLLVINKLKNSQTIFLNSFTNKMLHYDWLT